MFREEDWKYWELDCSKVGLNWGRGHQIEIGTLHFSHLLLLLSHGPEQ